MLLRSRRHGGKHLKLLSLPRSWSKQNNLARKVRRMVTTTTTTIMKKKKRRLMHKPNTKQLRRPRKMSLRMIQYALTWVILRTTRILEYES
jgi:hypothetical protein